MVSTTVTDLARCTEKDITGFFENPLVIRLFRFFANPCYLTYTGCDAFGANRKRYPSIYAFTSNWHFTHNEVSFFTCCMMVSLYGCSAGRRFRSICLSNFASAFGIYFFNIAFSKNFDANIISKPLTTIGSNVIHTKLQLPITHDSAEPIPANNRAMRAGHQRIMRKINPTCPRRSLLRSTAPLIMLSVC